MVMVSAAPPDLEDAPQDCVGLIIYSIRTCGWDIESYDTTGYPLLLPVYVLHKNLR